MKWYYLSRHGNPVIWRDHPVQSPIWALVQAAKEEAFAELDIRPNGICRQEYDDFKIIEVDV
mgnify:FL=1